MNTTKTSPNTISIIQAGLVLGTTLAWSEVVKVGAKQIYPMDDNKVFRAQLLYAIIITFILVIGFYILNKAEKHVNNIKDKLEKKIDDLNLENRELERQQAAQNRLIMALRKIKK